jgi:hypothetical protein
MTTCLVYILSYNSDYAKEFVLYFVCMNNASENDKAFVGTFLKFLPARKCKQSKGSICTLYHFNKVTPVLFNGD